MGRRGSLRASAASQPCGIETVHAAFDGEMAGKTSQVTFACDDLTYAACLLHRDGHTFEPAMRGKKGLDLILAFLRFQRTGAIDERAAGREKTGRMGEKARLQCSELVAVGGRFQPQHVGMAARGAGRRAGGVEQDRLPFPSRREGGRIRGQRFGGKAEAAEIFLQPFKARLRAAAASSYRSPGSADLNSESPAPS